MRSGVSVAASSPNYLILVGEPSVCCCAGNWTEPRGANKFSSGGEGCCIHTGEMGSSLLHHSERGWSINVILGACAIFLGTENQNQSTWNHWEKDHFCGLDSYSIPTEGLLDVTFPFVPRGIPVNCFGVRVSSRSSSPAITWGKSASWRKASATCANACPGPGLHAGFHWVGLYPLWSPCHPGSSVGWPLEQAAGVCAAQHLAWLFSEPLWGSRGPEV